MTRDFCDLLKKHDVKYFENFELSRISCVGIGGKALALLEPKTEEGLIDILDVLTSSNKKFKLVGNMTNLLPSDSGYDGVLIKTSKIRGYYVADGMLHISCGVLLSPAIKKIAELGYGGMESLYGIPGTVGGMVFNNAGAYGNDISTNFLDARIYFPNSKEIKVLNKSEMDFSYRHSSLKHNGGYLLSAKFKVAERKKSDIQNDIDKFVDLRKRSQPTTEKSLGSVFKRCDGVPISLLIDRLGLKGYIIGGAQVSNKHAGFIVNKGGATSADFIALIRFIKYRLRDEYGIIPEEEIEIL